MISEESYAVLSHYVLPGLILAGSLLLSISISIVRKIILSIRSNESTLFWEIIGLLVFFFFFAYLVGAYFVYSQSIRYLSMLVTLVYFAGSCFVYAILWKALSEIRMLIKINENFKKEIDVGREINEKLQEQTKATADANARMAQLYISLEEANINLEKKEIELKKQNTEISKINASLANANSNITNLYLELEQAKEELVAKKKQLNKQNKYLSKSNVLLADVFKKFVPEQFLERIAKQGIENIQYGYAERVNLSVLFSDIRFFTNMAEFLDPKLLLEILNKYFYSMSHQIDLNGGFIDKFIGDAIMSLFERAKQGNLSHATAALNAAIGMQLSIKNISQEIQSLTGFPLRVGIGIHSGEVILGTVGQEKRMNSTVLGNTVNVASRIERMTKEFGVNIIVSEDALKLIDDLYKYQYRNLGLVKIRGVQNAINLYEFFESDDEKVREGKYKTVLYFNRGVEYLIESNWEEAKKEFQASLKIYPDDNAAKYLLAQCDPSSHLSNEIK